MVPASLPDLISSFSVVSLSGNSQLIATVITIFSNQEMIKLLPPQNISELLHSCLQWISHENLTLSNSASQLLHHLALLTEDYCEQVVVGIMSRCLASEALDATIKMRYLGILSEIMGTGNEPLFAICLRHGATDAILKACEISDILAQVRASRDSSSSLTFVQMIALEYLPSLMSCQLGLDYLTTGLVPDSQSPTSHLDWLLEAASERGDDYLRAQCLTCTAILLSNLERNDHPFCHQPPIGASPSPSPYATTILPSFLSSLCNLLESSVESERLSGLSALSLFATSSPGAFLNTLSFRYLIPTWAALLRGQPSLQAPTLHTMAQVLLYPYVLNTNLPSTVHSLVPLPTPSHPPKRAEQLALSFLSQLSRHHQDHEEALTSVLASLHPLKKGLFDEIGEVAGRSSTMEFLIKLARQPIPETKLGAVDILRSLAYQDNLWGLQTLIRNVGFYNYIKVKSHSHLPPF
jgi:hypothetical protein